MRKTTPKPDPTRLEIFKNIFHSIAEEMGAVLRRSAFSPNIKERRDYSCAVYNANGEVLAMGDHMPVHLGSMPASVAAARSALALEPGDIAVLNDPFAGGTHLPDLTMVMPVHLQNKKYASFYVANRAHHADIGGALAGSMGPAREIFEEGLRIPPPSARAISPLRSPHAEPATGAFLKFPKNMANGNYTPTAISCWNIPRR